MNLIFFRRLLIREKPFLEKLLNKQTARPVLKRATIVQVDLLCRILFELTQGNISLSKDSYKALKRSQKLDLLHNLVGTKEEINSLISSTKPSKIVFLLQFSKQYCYLLHRLFYAKDHVS